MKEAIFILDLDHGYDDGPGVVPWANLKVLGRDALVGGRSTNRWAAGREMFFAMKFSRPFDRIELFADGKLVPDVSQDIRAKSLKAVIYYATEAKEQILVKTGISGVDSEGAMGNLLAEVPDWNFDGVRKASADVWERELSRIRVTGGTQKQRQIFTRDCTTAWWLQRSLTTSTGGIGGWMVATISWPPVSITSVRIRCGTPTAPFTLSLRLHFQIACRPSSTA
jgi:hypothetical protein